MASKKKSKAKSKSKKKVKKPTAKAAVKKAGKSKSAKAAARSGSKKKKPPSSAKKKKKKKSAGSAAPRLAAAARPEETLEGVELSDDASLLEALEKKLEAIKALRKRLREVVAREGSTLRTDTALNALNTAEGRVGARIAAVETPTLAPPGAEKVAALREAIQEAEEVIRQNQSVNELLAATTKLLDTLED